MLWAAVLIWAHSVKWELKMESSWENYLKWMSQTFFWILEDMIAVFDWGC